MLQQKGQTDGREEILETETSQEQYIVITSFMIRYTPKKGMHLEKRRPGDTGQWFRQRTVTDGTTGNYIDDDERRSGVADRLSESAEDGNACIVIPVMQDEAHEIHIIAALSLGQGLCKPNVHIISPRSRLWDQQSKPCAGFSQTPCAHQPMDLTLTPTE
jgi:hypothetical protein